jgi:hypothetical protein
MWLHPVWLYHGQKVTEQTDIAVTYGVLLLTELEYQLLMFC